VARIVLNPFGSFGDLHPFIAIGLELASRGHEPVIATSAVYRKKVEAEGLGFAPVRPDVGEFLHRSDLIERVWDAKRGTEYLLREIILPAIDQSFEDLEKAAAGAALLITHSAAFAGPIVAEYNKIPWLSAVLQPMAFLSRYDPPVLAPAPWLRHFYSLGQWPFALANAVAHKTTMRWLEPLLQLRRRLGLATDAHPFFEGQYSPNGTLALFSSHFAKPQPDWPAQTEVTGFAFYDQPGSGFEQLTGGEQELNRFLANGPPPLLFTLGSSAVMHPGKFFEASISAAHELRMRAVLLSGERKFDRLPETIFAAPYAPYSRVMPRSAAIVHQGGIGTTAQALRAGRPTLIVPWGHDQPDNAERTRKLGTGLMLPRHQYSARSAASHLRQLLETESYTTVASEMSKKISAENGVGNACDRIERELAVHHSSDSTRKL
jgi:rhamnosyltransferase subunit B